MAPSFNPSSADRMYKAVTHNIQVTVEPRFHEERSAASPGQFFWAYTITITNLGRDVVQLRTRHWRITDSHGRVQDVRGEGVVGEQPVLRPGQSFTYTSGVPLATDSGFMAGRFGMVTAAGEPFQIDVPTFSLDGPGERRTLN